MKQQKALNHQLVPEPREPPLSPPQAAPWLSALLGKRVSARMVVYWCQRGAVPAFRLGQRWLLWPSDLKAWAARPVVRDGRGKR
jgi:hypothetical protein